MFSYSSYYSHGIFGDLENYYKSPNLYLLKSSNNKVCFLNSQDFYIIHFTIEDNKLLYAYAEECYDFLNLDYYEGSLDILSKVDFLSFLVITNALNNTKKLLTLRKGNKEIKRKCDNSAMIKKYGVTDLKEILNKGPLNIRDKMRKYK